MPMIEDLRGGTSMISRDGRGELSRGAKRALEQQAANRRAAEGSPAEVEQRQAAAAEDMSKKRLQRFGAPWVKDPRGQSFMKG
jgi:hypothetical protein